MVLPISSPALYVGEPGMRIGSAFSRHCEPVRWGAAISRYSNGQQKYNIGMQHEYYVYIMSDAENKYLYTGVTNNFARRVYEHIWGEGSVFTRRYGIKKLVYYEQTESIESAVAREKQIKGGSRKKKVDLINALNPEWDDLKSLLFVWWGC